MSPKPCFALAVVVLLLALATGNPFLSRPAPADLPGASAPVEPDGTAARGGGMLHPCEVVADPRPGADLDASMGQQPQLLLGQDPGQSLEPLSGEARGQPLGQTVGHAPHEDMPTRLTR